MIGFDVKQLEYFAEAAKTKNFSKAAKNLFVSHQAVSKSIKILEEQLEMPLFERGAKGLTLTAFGVEFYEKLCEIVQQFNELNQLVSLYRKGHNQTIVIGFNSLSLKEQGGNLGNEVFSDLQEQYPGTNWKFIEMQGDFLLERFASGNLDFGINLLPESAPFNKVLLGKFPQAVIVTEESKLFRGKESVTLKDLTEGQMLYYSGEDTFYEIFSEMVSKEALTISCSPLRMRVDSFDGLMEADSLYAIRPLYRIMKNGADPGMRALPLVDGEGLPVELPGYIFWNKAKLTSVENNLVEYIVEVYRNKK
jgi:DNA-binding transcriptional LysR family regulator